MTFFNPETDPDPDLKPTFEQKTDPDPNRLQKSIPQGRVLVASQLKSILRAGAVGEYISDGHGGYTI
jgi:hypothetical protein